MQLTELPFGIHWHEYLDIPSLNRIQQTSKILNRKILIKNNSLSEYLLNTFDKYEPAVVVNGCTINDCSITIDKQFILVLNPKNAIIRHELDNYINWHFQSPYLTLNGSIFVDPNVINDTISNNQVSFKIAKKKRDYLQQAFINYNTLEFDFFRTNWDITTITIEIRTLNKFWKYNCYYGWYQMFADYLGKMVRVIPLNVTSVVASVVTSVVASISSGVLLVVASVASVTASISSGVLLIAGAVVSVFAIGYIALLVVVLVVSLIVLFFKAIIASLGVFRFLGLISP